jgi:hypothetical protein
MRGDLWPGKPQIDPVLGDLLELRDICLHVISLADMLGDAVQEGLREAVAALPPPPPAPPQPRTPLQDLLEAFDLEEEQRFREAVVHWNDGELRPLLRDAAAGAQRMAAEAREGLAVPDGRAAGALSRLEGALGAVAEAAGEPIVVPADADVHISDKAKLFKSWHIPASRLQDEEFEQPLRVPITDPEIIANIKAARAMLPVIATKHGNAEAGTLSWVKYPPRDTEGWMFAEPNDTEYGAWLIQRMKGLYEEMRGAYVRLTDEPSAPRSKLMAARNAQYLAAACIAIKEQEGAPSAINTYDGLVLSWGIGIAGPGKLPETFARITEGRTPESRRVRKALYLCGFKYEGTMIGSQFFGGYQIVDLQSDPPCVVYWDAFHHKDDPQKKVKKGEWHGRSFLALKLLVEQIEMLFLLIQLARDRLTREEIFRPNHDMIRRFGEVGYAEQIQTEALYVFAAQVKHNWGLGPEIVKWAVDHFDEAERRTGVPSLERDQAIAKGIVRYLMGVLQRQRWKNAVKKLEEKLAKANGKEIEPVVLGEMKAATEYTLARLIENYWRPLQTGAKTQDGSKVPVPGFLEPVPDLSAVPRGHYGWTEAPPEHLRNTKHPPPSRSYDLGPLSQMDLLFPHDDIKLVGIDLGGDIRIVDRRQERVVTREGKPR